MRRRSGQPKGLDEELRLLVERAKELRLESRELAHASGLRREQAAELRREVTALHQVLRRAWQGVWIQYCDARIEVTRGSAS